MQIRNVWYCLISETVLTCRGEVSSAGQGRQDHSGPKDLTAVKLNSLHELSIT